MDRNSLMATLIIITSIVGLGYFGLAMKRLHAETVSLLQSRQEEQVERSQLIENRLSGIYETQWHPIALTDNNNYVIEE